MSYRRMDELELDGKVVMIREDFNVPIEDGKITSDARIRAAIPTIKMALKAGAGVLLLSHLGRPVEGQPTPESSLLPVTSLQQLPLTI